MTYDHQYIKSLNHLYTRPGFGKEKDASVFLAQAVVNFIVLSQAHHFIKQDITYA